jgi:4a-hydroxytetrahydrobiopterin dehydratase
MSENVEKPLTMKFCKPCRPGDESLNPELVGSLLSHLQDWQLVGEDNSIQRRFGFKHFDETMMFVNKLATMSIEQDHHPDVNFGYNYCSVLFTTHAIKNLSENDFICAAKLDEIFVAIQKSTN